VRRYGTIGDFWQGKNKETLWDEIKAHERQIVNGLTVPLADEYAEFLHALTGGFFTLKRVRRSVGYFGGSEELDAADHGRLMVRRFRFPAGQRPAEVAPI
jgi:hypothetical protein